MAAPAPSAKPTTPKQYLDSLPEDRRKAIQAIRRVINANRDPKLREGIQYGMLGWFVPHSVYPAGYHCDPTEPLPFGSLASQKNHIGIYLFCLYTDEAEQARLVKAWKASGKRLDMGKSCIRVRSLEDVPLDVLGEAVSRMTCDRFVEIYESRWGGVAQARKKSAKKKASSKKTAAKTTAKKAATKSVSKKTAGKKVVKTKAPSKKTTTKKVTVKKAAKKTGKRAAKKTGRTRTSR